jgi:hypothetical protein
MLARALLEVTREVDLRAALNDVVRTHLDRV